MINKLLRHITQHTANNRNLLNSVNINLKQTKYLQTVVTQCFVNNKSEIWS